MGFEIKLHGSYEDIKIGERTFKMDTSDDKLREYVKVYAEYARKEEALKAQIDGLDPQNASVDAYDNLYSEVGSLLKETMDFVLERGAYDYVYGTTKSIGQTADVLMQLTSFIAEKVRSIKNVDQAKYLGVSKAEMEELDRERAKNLHHKAGGGKRRRNNHKSHSNNVQN